MPLLLLLLVFIVVPIAELYVIWQVSDAIGIGWTVLILFAGFCLIAAVWRELQGVPPTSHPDIKPISRALLVPMNFFLLLVAVAALAGIWSA